MAMSRLSKLPCCASARGGPNPVSTSGLSTRSRFASAGCGPSPLSVSMSSHARKEARSPWR